MNDSVLVNYYNINGKDYIILNELDYKDKHYVYLVNEDDSEDILIRTLKDNILYPMDSEKEFVEILKLFVKKF